MDISSRLADVPIAQSISESQWMLKYNGVFTILNSPVHIIWNNPNNPQGISSYTYIC